MALALVLFLLAGVIVFDPLPPSALPDWFPRDWKEKCGYALFFALLAALMVFIAKQKEAVIDPQRGKGSAGKFPFRPSVLVAFSDRAQKVRIAPGDFLFRRPWDWAAFSTTEDLSGGRSSK